MGHLGGALRVVRATERVAAAAQTPGMFREEALATGTLWSGIARTSPGNVSGWHHHAAWDTVAFVLAGACRLEGGAGGATVLLAEPGDYLFIPGGVVHRESNPSDVEQVLVVVRVGEGPVLVPVDGPPAA
ncbi:MAG: cupin domain-containing protein [Gemmatimonadales bacterium]|nr:cupin domain-containing protein [Gemmatimonadales bacterium]